MFSEYIVVQKLVVALLAGYLLGSIPFAYLGARYRGINIYATGSGAAGSANVFWNIGRRTGILVFTGDVAKGAVAVAIAGLLDAPWSVVLLAGGAAILGHWKSVFSRFRGGDGMATLIGVTATLQPALAAMGILIGFSVVLLMRRSSLRSAWGLVVCFSTMLAVSQYYQVDRDLVMGLVALAMLVIFRSVNSRRHRIQVPSEEDAAPDLERELGLELDLDLDLDLESDAEADLGPATPENR